jgi:hypothetical protein
MRAKRPHGPGGSPNLRGSAPAVSGWALNHSSPLCLPISSPRQGRTRFYHRATPRPSAAAALDAVIQFLCDRTDRSFPEKSDSEWDLKNKVVRYGLKNKRSNAKKQEISEKHKADFDQSLNHF